MSAPGKPDDTVDDGLLVPFGREELDLFVALREGYCRDDNAPFDLVETRRCFQELVGPAAGLGRGFFIRNDGTMVGYVVLTFGFSFEHGGRDAIVDEIYVRASDRRQGLGRRALEAIEALARRQGVRAIHVETRRSNPGAFRLYERLGYVPRPSVFSSKKL
ncbi:MAG TPA: GNAT family N-acetyltransferase [Polyangiaceae bacterium LLY-WYZ-14_1]|nr:GNAT family N-acetyltransferase [Polyangiaceae bacterium LLY-WYZ-14_1]